MLLAESSRIERIAVLTRTLVVAGELDTAEAAAAAGVSRRTIQYDLAQMSRVLPIRPDYSGRWIYMDSTESQPSLIEISPY